MGKTVQSIAFLCHIAEHYGVWGPFLVISPASTLHNWQQEMQRFVPDFKVVPYWGSPNERKILRQFWEQKDLHTREASFHVVITSYQLIVSDYKYFNRINWQYMVLDEAQAIKSSASARWKLLLGFNCRNRLLLSGTPIQNSMAELWALLHFIMPTLFDSHDEFNEWFSKDIESHAENKTGIDESEFDCFSVRKYFRFSLIIVFVEQISRLHMILKPFMLRRIKKDVENELSDKIEIMVYCPLTTRQRLLYMALKKKIRIEDLLQYTDRNAEGHGQLDKSFTSNLMNLVMQFRKVCNHPDLFERRDAKSPFSMSCSPYSMARLIWDSSVLQTRIPSKDHLLYNRFNVFKAENVHRSTFPRSESDRAVEYNRFVDLNSGGNGGFSFARLCGLSAEDVEATHSDRFREFVRSFETIRSQAERLDHRELWGESNPLRLLLLTAALRMQCLKFSQWKRDLLFTRWASKHPFFAFSEQEIHSMPETIEHRIIRSKKKTLIEEIDSLEVIDEKSVNLPSSLTLGHHHVPRPPRRLSCKPTSLPPYLTCFMPKAQCASRKY